MIERAPQQCWLRTQEGDIIPRIGSGSQTPRCLSTASAKTVLMCCPWICDWNTFAYPWRLKDSHFSGPMEAKAESTVAATNRLARTEDTGRQPLSMHNLSWLLQSSRISSVFGAPEQGRRSTCLKTPKRMMVQCRIEGYLKWKR